MSKNENKQKEARIGPFKTTTAQEVANNFVSQGPVVVGQLAEQLPPLPEVCRSNPPLGKFL